MVHEHQPQKNNPLKPAILYYRVSVDRQELLGESREYQEEKCRKYVELHDLDVIIVLKK